MTRAGQRRALRERARSKPVDEQAERWVAIARQVTEQRRARRLSQHELAELCGTTQSAIARLERGKRPPRLDTLARIANALDCDLVVQLRPRTTIRGRKS